MTRGRGRLIVGLAIAPSLWLGLVLLFVQLRGQHHLFVGHLDARIVDVGMVALNAGLLLAFVTISRSHRSRADEASR